jgi:DNA-binding response OmpR family regulator
VIELINMNNTILIVEPNKKLAHHLQKILSEQGMTVHVLDSALDLIETIDKKAPDLILLEHNLPNLKCFDICKEIKEKYTDLPIIVIIGQTDEEDIVHAFKLGAKDYITKPISTDDLLTRIRVRLMDQDSGSNLIKIDDLEINLDTYSVKRGDKKISLSPREFSLLKFLARNKGRVLSREVILNRVWDYPVDVQSRAVDVYVGYLRDKIDDGFDKQLIHTVRGFGYMIKENSD